MHGGRSPRQKGDRLERALVRRLAQLGIISVRVPQSGSRGGGDLVLPLCGRELVAEVKHRGDAFKQLYDWLDDRDLLLIKADQREMLVVLPLALAIEIIEQAIPHLQGGCS